MCTVTYLAEPNGFILTTNRDENPHRAKADPPAEYRRDLKIIYPRDPEGNGTWVAASRKKVVCLMNGAHEPHDRKPPYRHSRGKIVVDAFEMDDTETFFHNYRLDNIEPFTLIVASENSLLEMAWDGKTRDIQRHSPKKNYIWSAPMLYTQAARRKREVWFEQWLNEHQSFDQSKIIEFHLFGGEGDRNVDMRMDRVGEIPKTISITSMGWKNDGVSVFYHDLLNDRKTQFIWR